MTTAAYDALAPHLQRLVDAHMLGASGADVVRKLRPHVKHPNDLAAKWMARADVKAAVEERKAAAKAKAFLSEERWEEEIASIAHAKIRPKDIRPSDKNKALELAGRKLGLYRDTAGERDVVPTIILNVGVRGMAPADVTVTHQVVGQMPMLPKVTREL